MLVGVPRAGTTSLYHYLGQHPQINVSPMKEVNFLAYPGREAATANTPWLRFRVTTFDDYQQLFGGPGDVGIDFSSSCFRSPVAVERIRRYVPDARLLIVLRDPVSRAYSAYLNQLRKGYESRPPEVALEPGQRAVDNGFYSEHLSVFLDAFGPGRVKVWFFDDLVSRPTDTIAEVFEHLEVDPTFVPDMATVHNQAGIRRNRGGRVLRDYRVRRVASELVPRRMRSTVRRAWRRASEERPAPLPPSVAERLRALYRPDIVKVQELTGRDLRAWIDP